MALLDCQTDRRAEGGDTVGDMTAGKIFIKNDDGSYLALKDFIDMPTITDEDEPLECGVRFNQDDYSITMTFDRMSNKAIAAILGWRAKGPMRKRVLRKAFRMKPYKEPEAIPWE